MRAVRGAAVVWLVSGAAGAVWALAYPVVQDVVPPPPIDSVSISDSGAFEIRRVSNTFLITNNLFSRNRRTLPTSAVSSDSTTQAPSGRLRFLLVGVVMGRKPSAVLRDSGDASVILTIQEGDMVDGFSVSSILADSVVLTTIQDTIVLAFPRPTS